MNSHEHTILIVEDSVEDRIAYRRYLSREFTANYEIIEAESGAEGLKQIALASPDLILLDYLLPDLNGLEFIKELKFRTNQIPPIIMLTGHGNEIVAVEVMKSGAKDYLIKGKLTREIFTTSVKTVLKQQSLQFLLRENILQQNLIAETALRIRQSLNLAEILDTAVREVQLLLDCDRVVIYQFEPNLKQITGKIVAESLRQGCQKSFVTSHDLKAPLRAIANLATWLSEDLADQIPAENQEQLKLMQSRVQRMDSLIQGLLEYSRVGGRNTNVEIVNVGCLLDEIIETLAPPPQFTITIANNLPTLVTAKLLLEQVFTNLISNAIKYNFQSAGEIVISVEEQEHFHLVNHSNCRNMPEFSNVGIGGKSI